MSIDSPCISVNINYLLILHVVKINIMYLRILLLKYVYINNTNEDNMAKALIKTDSNVTINMYSYTLRRSFLLLIIDYMLIRKICFKILKY